MNSTNSMNFKSWAMSPEYLTAIEAECPWSSMAPLDFGSIDAPCVLAAGSHESYTGKFASFALPTTVLR